MGVEKQFNLQQYLNMTGCNSRDKWVANKVLAKEVPQSILDWTNLMISNKIIREATPSIIKLLTPSEILLLKK